MNEDCKMSKRAIRNEQDFEDFFQAFNRQDWELVLSFLNDDCVWDASEKRLLGLSAIKAYWTSDHSFIKETLGRPKNIVFGPAMAYLQVDIKLEFIADGSFQGSNYAKGSTVDLQCVDVYTFADDGTIKECLVYNKFKHS
jgi:hypothetical protein